jgi:hypothetical protein
MVTYPGVDVLGNEIFAEVARGESSWRERDRLVTSASVRRFLWDEVSSEILRLVYKFIRMSHSVTILMIENRLRHQSRV